MLLEVSACSLSVKNMENGEKNDKRMTFLNSKNKDGSFADVIEQFMRVFDSVIDVILAFPWKLQLSGTKVKFEERLMNAI